MGSMAHQTNSSTVRIRHGYGLIHHPRKKKKKTWSILGSSQKIMVIFLAVYLVGGFNHLETY